VCRVRVLANIVEQRNEAAVTSVEETNEKTIITHIDGKAAGKRISEHSYTMKKSVEGLAKSMPVIGTWRSADGAIFYLAIGAAFDKDGRPVPSP
jgi:hypothetical protein